MLFAALGASTASAGYVKTKQFSTIPSGYTNSSPHGIAVGSNGDLLIADSGLSQPPTHFIEAITRFSTAGASVGQYAVNAMTYPTDIATGPDGTIYALEEGGRVLRYSADGSSQLGTWNTSGNAIATGPSGEVFVLDGSGLKVRVFSSAGGYQREFALVGIALGYPGPRGIHVDAAGRVYVTDTMGDAVQVYQGATRVQTIAGGGLDGPWDVATDAKGNVIVASALTNSVKVYTPAGVKLDEFGSSAQFGHAAAVTVDGAGTVWVMDPAGSPFLRVSGWVPNTEPTEPGAPIADEPEGRDGAYTVSWPASQDPDIPYGDSVSYTLSRRSQATGFSNVAAGITSPSYTFGSGGVPAEGEGRWTYRVMATDSFGARTIDTLAAAPAVVDRTAPTPPTLSLASGQSPVNVAGTAWYADSVSVAVAAGTDPALADDVPTNPLRRSPGTGVDPATAQPFTATGNGEVTVSRTNSDRVGNESAAAEMKVHIDSANPELRIEGCPDEDVRLGSEPTVEVAASDGESGLASDPSGTVALDADEEGPQELSVTAEDRVGHRVSLKCEYFVRFMNTIPSDPGKPDPGTALSRTGEYTVAWGASDNRPDFDLVGDKVSYTLQHRDEDDADWSTVESGLASPSRAVDEDDGTWTYRVQASDDNGGVSGWSEISDPVKVDGVGALGACGGRRRRPDGLRCRWRGLVPRLRGVRRHGGGRPGACGRQPWQRPRRLHAFGRGPRGYRR